MLAKLSKPILHQAIPRLRLFERLDDWRRHPILWICGPAGAGKSSLVAGYIEARGAAARWMHLDAGDQDPATFFYFLRELLPEQARGAIPIFTPEHALNLAAFSHLFFRALFAALPPESLLVLDNVQEAMSADVGMILKEGLTEVPITHALVLISRERLPANLARFRLSGALQVIDWDDLRFTEEEASALANRLGVPDEHARALRAQVDGWAAGLVLMCSGAASAVPHALRSEALFEYFAGEVFERATPAEREALLTGGLLSEFSASLLGEVTGLADAHTLLDRLYKAQFFITRSDGPEPAFRFHALFREFLLGRLAIEKSAEELTALRRAAAEALAKRGRNEEAIGLLLSDKQFELAAARLRTVAAELVKFGRGNVLLYWLAMLPEDRIAADPWLTYWRGAAVLWGDPEEAYRWFERAFSLFEASDDQKGQLAAAVSALRAIDVSLTNFYQKDRWIELVHRLLPVEDCSDDDLRLRAWCGFLVGAMDRAPTHPRIPDAVAALMRSLQRSSLPPDLRLTVLNALMNYALSSLDELVSDHALAEFRISKDFDACSASSLCDWFCWVGWYRYSRGEWEQAIEYFDRMIETARAARIETVQRAGEVASATMHLLAGRIEHARGEFERLSLCLLPHQHAARRLILKSQAILDMRLRRTDKAMRRFEDALRSVDAFGPADLCACSRISMAEVFAHDRQRETAQKLIEQVAAFVRGTHHRYQDAAIAAVRAFADPRGSSGCPSVDQVAVCMQLLERQGRRGTFLVVRDAAAFVLNYALEYGIQSQLAHDLIVAEGLQPPSGASSAWPWHIRIKALGTFNLQIDGAVYRREGRSPQKVLEMLKVLLSCGSREQYSTALSDALWPDADGDEAKISLHTALHRLRRLLRDEEAVRLQGGKLWLDRELCWADVWTFEHQADALLASGHALNTAEQDEARRTLALYEGPLLPGDDHPALLHARERLHNKFIKLSIRFGEALADGQNWHECTRTFDRALEIDPANRPIAARRSRILALRDSALAADGSIAGGAPAGGRRGG